MTYIILLICFAIGVPIVFSLGLSCVLAILTDPSMSMIWITQKMFAGVNSFPYLALPSLSWPAISWPRAASPAGW